MSTVAVTSVKSLTASTPPIFKESGGTEVGQLCRAWVNFNGTGTVAINDSFNVSSITDHGTGDYTINFTNALPSANYSPVFGWNSGTATTIPYFVAIKGTGSAHTSKTTTALRIIYAGTGGISTDAYEILAAVFGD